MKKIIMIIIFVLILLCIIGFVIQNQTKNTISTIKLDSIQKDIIIEKRSYVEPDTGYASTFYDYYIDLKKKEIYEVKNYYVFNALPEEESESHSTLTKTKKLKTSQINDLLNLIQTDDSSYNDTTSTNSDIYYHITYHEKTMTLDYASAPAIASILDSM